MASLGKDPHARIYGQPVASSMWGRSLESDFPQAASVPTGHPVKPKAPPELMPGPPGMAVSLLPDP